MPNYSSLNYGGPSAADLAKKAEGEKKAAEKAKQDALKKYCQDNGYPATPSFCAAFKEEAIQACKDGVTEWYRLEVSDAKVRLEDSTLDCTSTFASPELWSSLLACSDEAFYHYQGAMIGIEDDKNIRNENCSKSP